MKYQVHADSIAKDNASIQIKQSSIDFGITSQSADSLPNPAELFLGSLSACMLKNLERFSILMKFNYTKASIHIEAKRNEKPPSMEAIKYDLKIYSQEKHINVPLLLKNIENYGTIYNTIKAVCEIEGSITVINN